jgi:hypothetical protein
MLVPMPNLRDVLSFAGLAQEQEIAMSTGRPAVYYQPCNNGPIFNGAIYGNIQSNMQVSTLDGM